MAPAERPQALPAGPLDPKGVLNAVTANYGACNRTADALDGLQAWVLEQRKVRP